MHAQLAMATTQQAPCCTTASRGQGSTAALTGGVLSRLVVSVPASALVVALHTTWLTLHRIYALAVAHLFGLALLLSRGSAQQQQQRQPFGHGARSAMPSPQGAQRRSGALARQRSRRQLMQAPPALHPQQQAAGAAAAACKQGPPAHPPPALGRTSRDQGRPCGLPLAPQAPPHSGRLTVVLDLDETLVCAYRLDQLPLRLRPRLHTPTCTFIHWGQTGDASTMVVLERPGVRAFLEQAACFAELVLFTAGAASYALPLARHLDPRGTLFGGRLLFRDATTSVGGSAGGGGARAVSPTKAGAGAGAPGPAPQGAGAPSKDLSRLGRPLARTVLVDNSATSFVLQPANGIPCAPFRGCATDCHLLAVILPLLASLCQAPDVRPILSERFQLAAWLAGKGLLPPPAEGKQGLEEGADGGEDARAQRCQA